MRITMESLLETMKTDRLALIDLRTEESFLQGHIDTAINIPAQKLLEQPEKYLKKSEIYYLYCYSGHISSDVSQQLNYLGYHTISVFGGYNYYLLCQ